MRGKLGDWRGNIERNWSRWKFPGHNTGFGDVGWNWETSVVVSSTSPEITEPLRNVGGSNEIIEGTSWKMITPGKP